MWVFDPHAVSDCENFAILLAVFALRSVLPGLKTNPDYPFWELFHRIGMRNTPAGVDRFDNFVLRSQVYTNARDLARLGMLYLNVGVWNGERILPRERVDYVRTPACATRDFGRAVPTGTEECRITEDLFHQRLTLGLELVYGADRVTGGVGPRPNNGIIQPITSELEARFDILLFKIREVSEDLLPRFPPPGPWVSARGAASKFGQSPRSLLTAGGPGGSTGVGR